MSNPDSAIARCPLIIVTACVDLLDEDVPLGRNGGHEGFLPQETAPVRTVLQHNVYETFVACAESPVPRGINSVHRMEVSPREQALEPSIAHVKPENQSRNQGSKQNV